MRVVDQIDGQLKLLLSILIVDLLNDFSEVLTDNIR